MITVVADPVTRRRPAEPATVFARAFTEWMRGRELSPGEVSEALGYTPQYVRQLARGDAKPSWAFLARFAAQYGEDIDRWGAVAGFEAAKNGAEDADLADRLADRVAERLAERYQVLPILGGEMAQAGDWNGTDYWLAGLGRLARRYSPGEVRPQRDDTLPPRDESRDDLDLELSLLEQGIRRARIRMGLELPAPLWATEDNPND